MFTRRTFLAASASLPLLACSPQTSQSTPTLPAKRIAITMDDFSTRGDVLARDALIRAALTRHKATAVGFVTTQYLDEAEGRQIVADWAADGHHVANHTHTHPWSDKIDTDAFWADVLTAHDKLKDMPGFMPSLRFPYLRDGGTRDQQLDYHARLNTLGYAHAPISVESFDWYVTTRMENAIKEGRDPKPFGDYWRESVVELANHYHRVATQLDYPDLPHVMLTHHIPVTGLFLGDLMDDLAQDGWSFVDGKDALAHPLYAQLPPELTNSRNWLDVIASARGAEVDPYPKKYYQYGGKTMDALGL